MSVTIISIINTPLYQHPHFDNYVTIYLYLAAVYIIFDVVYTISFYLKYFWFVLGCWTIKFGYDSETYDIFIV